MSLWLRVVSRNSIIAASRLIALTRSLKLPLHSRVHGANLVRHGLGVLDLRVAGREVVVEEEHQLVLQRDLPLDHPLHPLVVGVVDVAAARLEGLAFRCQQLVRRLTTRQRAIDDALNIRWPRPETGSAEEMPSRRSIEHRVLVTHVVLLPDDRHRLPAVQGARGRDGAVGDAARRRALSRESMVEHHWKSAAPALKTAHARGLKPSMATLADVNEKRMARRPPKPDRRSDVQRRSAKIGRAPLRPFSS